MTGTEVKSMIKGAGLKCWEVAYAMVAVTKEKKAVIHIE